MRRTSSILVVLFSALTGCRGSEAQVPYDGLISVEQRPTQMAPPRAVQASESQPMSSEPRAPWAIALLSDAPERPTNRSGKMTVVAAAPEPSPTADSIAHEADIYVALESNGTDDKPAAAKPAAPKSCSGVVNRRS